MPGLSMGSCLHELLLSWVRLITGGNPSNCAGEMLLQHTHRCVQQLLLVSVAAMLSRLQRTPWMATVGNRRKPLMARRALRCL